jgi:Ca2+-binding RTX toxin-like protein
MRRTATILAVVALMVTFSSSVALASFENVITGTDRTDVFTGTGKAEHIFGLGGGDRINAGGGNDLVEGGQGADELGDGLGQDTVYGGSGQDNLIGQGGDTSPDRFYAGIGNDIVQPVDTPAVHDFVNCGPGTDTVYADKADVINDNCERVRVQ